MRWLLVALWAGAAQAGPSQEALDKCLSCHLQPEGLIDIVGLAAIEALPAQWPFLFEDVFDMDGDGIAGRLRMVSGPDGPIVGKYGSALSAGRFADFALMAGAAHDIPDLGPGTLAYIEAGFGALSPAPDSPFASAEALRAFAQSACAACHVTRSFQMGGQEIMPLSDFLLHDLGEGPKRTKPLWACAACIRMDPPPHGWVLAAPG